MEQQPHIGHNNPPEENISRPEVGKKYTVLHKGGTICIQLTEDEGNYGWAAEIIEPTNTENIDTRDKDTENKDFPIGTMLKVHFGNRGTITSVYKQ